MSAKDFNIVSTPPPKPHRCRLPWFPGRKKWWLTVIQCKVCGQKWKSTQYPMCNPEWDRVK